MLENPRRKKFTRESSNVYKVSRSILFASSEYFQLMRFSSFIFSTFGLSRFVFRSAIFRTFDVYCNRSRIVILLSREIQAIFIPVRTLIMTQRWTRWNELRFLVKHILFLCIYKKSEKKNLILNIGNRTLKSKFYYLLNL